MTMREEWLALAKKCRRIKGPHTRLDAQIALASGEQILRVYNDGGWSMAHRGDVHWWTHCPASAAKKGVARHAQGAIMGSIKRVPYTSSIEAITGLIARALPGWHWEVGADRSAMMRNPGEWRGAADDICIWGAASPALALCEAFCRAMAEKAK